MIDVLVVCIMSLERLLLCEMLNLASKCNFNAFFRKKHMSKEFNCDKCDFVSDSKAAIRMHRQIHNSGSFICEICGKAFTSRDSIQKHKNVR